MKRAVLLGAVYGAALSLWLTPVPIFGQHMPPQAADSVLTLHALLEEVRANNLSLHISRLEAAALDARVRQVSTFPDPSVSVGYLPFALVTARGKQRSQWRVEQMVPYPGRLALQGEASGLEAKVARFETATLEADLLLRVKLTYYELFRLQRHQTRTLAFQDRLQSFAKGAAARYAAGTGTQQAILRIQVERSRLTQTLMDLAAQRKTALETMANLLNRPAFGTGSDNIHVATPPSPSIVDTLLLDLALAQRPEAGALDAAAKRAQANIALARLAYKPDFGLSLTYWDISRFDALSTGTGRDGAAIGLSVKVPLQRARLRAQLQEAQVRRDQILAQQDALKTSIQTQIADLVSRLDTMSEQLALFSEMLIPQATASLHATLSAYATGSADFTAVLDAETLLFSLGTDYEEAFSRYLSAGAALERVVGANSVAEMHAH